MELSGVACLCRWVSLFDGAFTVFDIGCSRSFLGVSAGVRLCLARAMV